MTWPGRLQLINIGLGASCQTIPAIAGAVVLNLHSKPLIFGITVGLVVVIWTELYIEHSIEKYGAADPYTDGVHWFHSFVWGMLANVVCVALGEVACAVMAVSDPDK